MGIKVFRNGDLSKRPKTHEAKHESRPARLNLKNSSSYYGLFKQNDDGKGMKTLNWQLLSILNEIL